MARPQRVLVRNKMQRRQNRKGQDQAAQTQPGNRKDSEPDHRAGVGRRDRALVRGPKSNRKGVQNQRQTETDEQRIFDARFFVRFHDEVKERPIEQ